jgi:hypothetical protein
MRLYYYLRSSAALVLVALTLVLAPDSAFAETFGVAWDPSADPAVVGYVVRVGSTSGIYTQSFDVGGATTFSYPAAVPGVAYYFSVVAYAPGPVFSLPSAEVSGFSNAPPTIAPVANQTGITGSPVSLQLSGSDPYGDPLTFTTSGLPSGVTMVGGTGLLTGTPTSAGSFFVKATVSDGALSSSTTFTWTITTPTATAPVLIAPSGTLTTATPEFVWQAATNAASYQLAVTDSQSQTAIQRALSASEAGCPLGGTCRVSPGVTLAAGTASWRVQTTTAAGATAWSTAMTFTVPQVADTTPPTIAITAPTTALTYAATQSALVVSGTAGDNAKLAQVRWSTDRGESGLASTAASWSMTVPLHGGTNVLTVTAQDATGNSASAILTISYVSAPVLVSPSGAINTTTPSFVWQPAAGAVSYALEVDDSAQAKKIALQLTAAAAGCSTAGLCTVNPGVQLAAGQGRWVVQTIAASGTGPLSTPLTFKVPDVVAPAVTIASPTSATTLRLSQSTVTLAGTSSDNVGVASVSWISNRGRSGTASGTTSWSALVTLDEGDNILTVKAADGAGNTSSDVVTVTYATPDTSGPAIAIATPTSLPAYAATAALTIAGSAMDQSGVSKVWWKSDRGTSGIFSGTSQWGASVPLQAGTNAITVSATDTLGNTSSQTATVVYVAPVAPIAPTGTIAVATPTFSWAASPIATEYVLRVDDSTQREKILMTVTPAATGCGPGAICTVSPGVALAAGIATWSVKASVGGIGAWSAPVQINVQPDLVAPTVSITSPTKGGSYNTSNNVVVLEGVASDNTSSFYVVWQTDRGARGAAAGTFRWKTAGIPLFAGVNVITVTVRDGGGNIATDVLTVSVKSGKSSR